MQAPLPSDFRSVSPRGRQRMRQTRTLAEAVFRVRRCPVGPSSALPASSAPRQRGGPFPSALPAPQAEQLPHSCWMLGTSASPLAQPTPPQRPFVNNFRGDLQTLLDAPSALCDAGPVGPASPSRVHTSLVLFAPRPTPSQFTPTALPLGFQVHISTHDLLTERLFSPLYNPAGHICISICGFILPSIRTALAWLLRPSASISGALS